VGVPWGLVPLMFFIPDSQIPRLESEHVGTSTTMKIHGHTTPTERTLPLSKPTAGGTQDFDINRGAIPHSSIPGNNPRICCYLSHGLNRTYTAGALARSVDTFCVDQLVGLPGRTNLLPLNIASGLVCTIGIE